MPLLLKNNQFRRKVKKIRQKGLIVGTIGRMMLTRCSTNGLGFILRSSYGHPSVKHQY